ncbi:MAG: hypothetical protein U9O56_02970 [Campylobacterota bacterium]|nr:hypothetical protein [Campylobacterota bacterium]
MNNFTAQLTADINKLVGLLRPEDDLNDILKKRLTKKEYKYFKLRMNESSDDMIKSELHCDDKRFEEIKKQTLLKINQEKLKNELVE